MHELVTDQGVLRIGDDGVLELFRDLDGRAVNRVLVWGCEAAVSDSGPPVARDAGDPRPDGRGRAPGDAREATLTVTRKGLPVVSVRLPRAEREDAEVLAAAIRAHARPR